jgi:all-trans-retinol 13,14-reductase
MSTGRGGVRGIFLGFVPWMAYWILSGAGVRPGGVVVAFATALLVCGWPLRRGRPKPVELVALAFFGANLAVWLVFGALLPAIHDAVLVSGALATMAWGTLLAGSPFTAQYARQDWPREYWRAPLFLRINALLTAVWGVVFTTNAGLGALAIIRPEARLWLVAVLPQVGIGAGVALSIVVPRWYPRRWAAREIAAREPYDWSPPAFGLRADGARHDVIVVGAGIGGLTAGALLADRGARVLVIEQHYLPGGFCTSWPRIVRRGDQRLRYVFDAGVHDVSGLGARGPVRHLLERLEIGDRLEWRRMGHEYILPGFRLKVPRRAADLVATLADRFPAERTALGAFFAQMEAVYRELYADVDVTGGVPRPPRTVEEMLGYPVAHPHAFRWMQVPFGAMLDTCFREPRLKEFLSVLTGYLSDDPRTLTVGGMAPIFGYYFDGGYYPVGGSQALADALVGAIRDRGGEVRLRTPARRILVEDGRAVGVESGDGRLDRAGAIVANADAHRTFLELVGRERLPSDFLARIERTEPSTSAFSVFLGLDCVPDIEPITIVAGDGQGLAIAVPSLVDPSLAPPGHSSVTLITLVPPRTAGEWNRNAPGYTELKRRTGNGLIARAELAIPGLREHVVYRQDGSPATFARYAWTTGGAIYGPAVGQWRPPAKSPVEGLVLAGAGVFPGAGVEAVVISGTLAADALCPDRTQARRTPDDARMLASA